MNWRKGIRALAAFWAFAGAFFIIIGTVLFLAANGYPAAAAFVMLAVASAFIFWLNTT
jgi:hypothetical protein